MEQENVTKSKNKLSILLVIIIVALSGAFVYMLMEYNKMKTDNAVVQEALEEQKNSLTNELQDLMGEYEDLKTDNDSMNIRIEGQQKKIKQLLAVNANNMETIKLYKKELNTLREVMRSYIVQIDSLNQRNQMLVTENTEVKGKLDDARKSNESLEKQKQELNSKVEMAAVMVAKGITGSGLSKREKETEKASSVAKVKVCFTVRENPLLKSGDKTVYLRISRPDNLVLANSNDDVFDYEGSQLAYSAKRVIDYQNKDLDVCVYFDNTGKLIPGIYTLDIFCDGKMIGTSSMTLKKGFFE